MVVEHVFVTTMEAPEAMNTAMQFLASHGFITNQPAGFLVGQSEWNSLEMRRGKVMARGAKSIRELPQRVHVEFDRGRVTVAVSIEASAAWGGGTSFGTSLSENPKKMKLHQQLLTSLAQSLELLLSQHQTHEQAQQGLLKVEKSVLEAADNRSRRNWIILGVVLVIMVVATVAAIMLA